MASWPEFYRTWDSDEARSLLALKLPSAPPKKDTVLSKLLAKTRSILKRCKDHRPVAEVVESGAINVLATLLQQLQEAPCGAWHSMAFEDGSADSDWYSVLKPLCETVESIFKARKAEGPVFLSCHRQLKETAGETPTWPPIQLCMFVRMSFPPKFNCLRYRSKRPLMRLSCYRMHATCLACSTGLLFVKEALLQLCKGPLLSLVIEMQA